MADHSTPGSAGPVAPETLVLLPGMLCGPDLWSDVVERLPVTLAVVHVPLGGSDSVDAMARAALGAAPGRLTLVGHSLGGIVALAAACLAPERVGRVVVLNTSPLGASRAQLAAWESQRRQVDDGGFTGIAAAQPDLLLPPHRRADEVLRRRIEAMATAVGPDAFVRQLVAQSGRADLRPRLARLHHPVLVVSGGDDQVCPPARQEELAAALPHATLERIDRCGHMTPMEQPLRFTEILLTWLATCPTPRLPLENGRNA